MSWIFLPALVGCLGMLAWSWFIHSDGTIMVALGCGALIIVLGFLGMRSLSLAITEKGLIHRFWFRTRTIGYRQMLSVDQVFSRNRKYIQIRCNSDETVVIREQLENYQTFLMLLSRHAHAAGVTLRERDYLGHWKTLHVAQPLNPLAPRFNQP